MNSPQIDTDPPADAPAAQTSYLQHVLARVRQRQLALARAGRIRESSRFARWAQRVREVARRFDSAPADSH